MPNIADIFPFQYVRYVDFSIFPEKGSQEITLAVLPFFHIYAMELVMIYGLRYIIQQFFTPRIGSLFPMFCFTCKKNFVEFDFWPRSFCLFELPNIHMDFLRQGFKIVTLPKFEPETYIKALTTYRPTFLNLVSLNLEMHSTHLLCLFSIWRWPIQVK